MRTIGNIGFILLLVGGCSLGSDSIIPPIVAIIGLFMLLFVALKEQIKIDH